MKLLTVYYKYKRGGSYHRLRMMLEAYAEAGDKVYYIAVEKYPFELPGIYPQILNTPFRNYESTVFRVYFLLVSPLYALSVCLKNRIDFLIAVGGVNAFVQALTSLLLRKKMVTFIRADSSDVLRLEKAPKVVLLVNRLLERIGLFFSHRIIVNNRDLKERVEVKIGKRPGKVQILYNNIVVAPKQSHRSGIVTDRQRFGIGNDEFLIVTVGLLNRRKNIELLLETISDLGMKKVKLLIVGDVLLEGEDARTRLEHIAKTMQIEGQVIFAGWKESTEVHEILSLADLFVFPSFHEGSPNALLEALGHDKPCLGSRVPGISDVLYFDELLFDPYDGRELLEKIERAILDGRYLEKILELSLERRKAFTFDWKKALLDITRTLS